MILVTRPARASAATAARLAAMGEEVLVEPLLDLAFMPPDRLVPPLPDSVVITSSNGARAVAGHPDLAALTPLPLWTVGARTSAAARELGFQVCGEAPDAAALGALLAAEPAQHLLYIAAENRSADFSALAPRHHIRVLVVYRAIPAAALSPEASTALRDGRIATVLHYSRRLAETYLALADSAGIAGAALMPQQLCLSEQVAAPLRAAGASSIFIAAEPKEDALLALLAG